MSKIGLFYSTTTGKTELVAETIQTELGGSDVISIHDIADATQYDFNEYEC